MKKELEYLKTRADKFLKYAKTAFSQADYEMAAFDLEQSAQLYLKYTLGLLIGDFPRTHSLRELIENVYKISAKKELQNILIENENVIASLEDAYLTSRYVPAVFTKNQVEQMNKFLRQLKDILKTLWI